MRGRVQFRKGTSGNPAGRPEGARNKTTLAVWKGEAETITRKAIEKAKEGENCGYPHLHGTHRPAAQGQADSPLAGMHKGRMAFLEKNADDLTIASAILIAPTFLSGLTEAALPW
jgi:hypothetical protein